mmetsp:Transcript_27069/g.28118  ORF Transcript_27069/g.28118 Transcript_27069/m.28118 type:complete len:107 (+) Transcript_27069:1298-1618(+)
MNYDYCNRESIGNQDASMKVDPEQVELSSPNSISSKDIEAIHKTNGHRQKRTVKIQVRNSNSVDSIGLFVGIWDTFTNKNDVDGLLTKQSCKIQNSWDRNCEYFPN